MESPRVRPGTRTRRRGPDRAARSPPAGRRRRRTASPGGSWSPAAATRPTAGFFAALAPGNQAWAGAANALVFVPARTTGDDGSPQPWALYDTGQAVAALVTQAQADGLAIHQMGGFDSAAVRAELGPGDTLTPIVILAIGRPDSTADLPGALAARETAPRTRPQVSDLLLPARTAPQPQAA